ncbi:MAG: class I mannose-6-phosphate isomerase [Candidatus Humimicrobiaceae bacterium]
MGWYINKKGLVNQPLIEKSMSDSILKGNDKVFEKICDLIEQHNQNSKKICVIALDGFIGVEWRSIVNKVEEILNKRNLEVETIDMNFLFKPIIWIDNFVKPYVTNDPSFGYVCKKGRLKHLFDYIKTRELKKKINSIKRNIKMNPRLSAVLCYGIGAAIADLKSLYDLIFYFDVSRITIMDKMNKNELIPLGALKPTYVSWKLLYYVYFPILIKHKDFVLNRMDWYLDCNDIDELKLIPNKTYKSIISTLIKYPLKFVRVLMPGSWGGYKLGKYFNVPELSNCAWDLEVSNVDSSLVVDVGNDITIEISFWNLYSQFPIEVVGSYCHKKYPGSFPIQVALEDGYFEKPVPHKRSAMPIHLHPNTNYIKRKFNEQIGRYEVYYIVEAYEGASVMLGFREDADLEEFKKEIIEAEENKIEFDWSKYVKTWPVKEGDLVLIPPNTVHGSCGNLLELEMDTHPSKQATEYSFFLYDYLRNTWDDDKKSMSGKPVKLHLKHGFEQINWNQRESWVKKNLFPKTNVKRSGKSWSEEQFISLSGYPYYIERLNFENRFETDTLGKFFHFLCLTKGERVLIKSIKNPEKKIELKYIQCTVIPASFGKYECINIGKEPCSLMRQRWKKG